MMSIYLERFDSSKNGFLAYYLLYILYCVQSLADGNFTCYKSIIIAVQYTV